MTNKPIHSRESWEIKIRKGAILVLLLIAIFYCVYFSKCHGEVAYLG